VEIVYARPFEPVVRSRLILRLGLPSSANGKANDHYQSVGIVCLSVNRGLQRAARKRSISFNMSLNFNFLKYLNFRHFVNNKVSQVFHVLYVLFIQGSCYC